MPISRTIPLVCLTIALATAPLAGQSTSSTDRQEQASDWPAWRGPLRNNVALGPAAPVRWSEEENILWQVPIPGHGHSSPIILGDHLYLTSADPAQRRQWVACYHLQDGREIWQTTVNDDGGFPPEIHSKNTHASATLASSGDRLFALFNHHDQVHLTALDRKSGQILWQKPAGPYAPEKYRFGFGSSPMVHDDLIFVASEFEEGFLAAFRQSDGQEVWRIPRLGTSYSTPIVAHLEGKDQLLLTGLGQLTSYDPQTGEVLWTAEGPSTATCGTVVWEDGLVFASGGFPESQTMAVKADGSGEIVWTNRERCYEQSLVVHDGYLYAFNDTGIALCWEAKTGRQMWKERLGGKVSASPVIQGEHIYFTNESGSVFVVKTDPEKFEIVSENRLGDETFATPTIHQGRIYLRIATRTGDTLQESLVCIGQE